MKNAESGMELGFHRMFLWLTNAEWSGEMGRECGKKADATLRGQASVQFTLRPATTPFWLASISGLLNRLTDRFGSEPSFAATDSIASITHLAESSDSRLQFHAATHSPGTMILRNNKLWREVRLLYPASHHVRRFVAVLIQLPNYRVAARPPG